MRLVEIEKKARAVGIKDTWKYSKNDLIKLIQRTEGNFDCFGVPQNSSCDQLLCSWRSDCIR